MESLVSIVLPVYNGEKYLRESIDSICAQTWRNWELIIVDDGSTDKTAEIAKEYAAKDQRIFYYKNEQNLRLPKNLNRGFSLAKGEYLTWTSDDNMYLPIAIEKMVKQLEVSHAEFVFASCRIIDSDGREVEYNMVNESSLKRIVGNNPVGACFMYTRKVYQEIGKYDPDYTLVEDFDYWQRIAMKFPITTIEEILYKYRWHSGALTSTMKKDTFNRILEKMLLKNRPGFGKLDWEQNYYYYSSLSSCRKNLDEENPYILKEKWYSFLYFIKKRVPNKFKRILGRI
ncbi:glycosyltransferase family 2 protein [Butyricicoccus porcorum]|uniref:glycosyltransferase family 2 protein n=1 Tax=Butyricicoccus porcorum TaxID=1945634 RepID=UPI003F4ACF94